MSDAPDTMDMVTRTTRHAQVWRHRRRLSQKSHKRSFGWRFLTARKLCFLNGARISKARAQKSCTGQNNASTKTEISQRFFIFRKSWTSSFSLKLVDTASKKFFLGCCYSLWIWRGEGGGGGGRGSGRLLDVQVCRLLEPLEVVEDDGIVGLLVGHELRDVVVVVAVGIWKTTIQVTTFARGLQIHTNTRTKKFHNVNDLGKLRFMSIEITAKLSLSLERCLHLIQANILINVGSNFKWQKWPLYQFILDILMDPISFNL